MPGTTMPDPENLQMNIWSTVWADPRDMYEAGYSLINMQNNHLYVIPGGGYDHLDTKDLYDNWEPNKFYDYNLLEKYRCILRRCWERSTCCGMICAAGWMWGSASMTCMTGLRNRCPCFRPGCGENGQRQVMRHSWIRRSRSGRHPKSSAEEKQDLR